MTRNMRAVYVLARLTLLEAIRSKLLFVLVLFIAGILVSSHFVAYLSLAEQAKIFKDLALGLLSLLTCVLAIVLPVEQMQREKERNSLAAMLVKPLHRYGFIAGKFLGMCFVLLFVVCSMAGLIFLLLKFRGVLWDVEMLKACLMILCQGLILVSCAFLLGIVFSGHFLPLVCGVSIYLVGNLLEPLREWVEHAGNMGSKIGGVVLLYLAPHLENLNIQDSVALGQTVRWGYVTENIAYALMYSLVVFFISAIVFNQKDF